MSALAALASGITSAVASRPRDCCPVPGLPCDQQTFAVTRGAPRACLIGPYARDHEHLSGRLRDKAGAGFALARYADGELATLRGEQIGNAEWFIQRGEAPKLRQALRDSLKGHWGEDFFYGFPTVRRSRGAF